MDEREDAGHRKKGASTRRADLGSAHSLFNDGERCQQMLCGRIVMDSRFLLVIMPHMYIPPLASSCSLLSLSPSPTTVRRLLTSSSFHTSDPSAPPSSPPSVTTACSTTVLVGQGAGRRRRTLASGKRVVVEMGTSERNGAEGERTWLGGEKGRIAKD